MILPTPFAKSKRRSLEANSIFAYSQGIFPTDCKKTAAFKPNCQAVTVSEAVDSSGKPCCHKAWSSFER
jgi:hypothetical protein